MIRKPVTAFSIALSIAGSAGYASAADFDVAAALANVPF